MTNNIKEILLFYKLPVVDTEDIIHLYNSYTSYKKSQNHFENIEGDMWLDDITGDMYIYTNGEWMLAKYTYDWYLV